MNCIYLMGTVIPKFFFELWDEYSKSRLTVMSIKNGNWFLSPYPEHDEGFDSSTRL